MFCNPCCCSRMHFNLRTGINLENLKIKIKWKITLYQGGRKLSNCVRNKSQYYKFYIKVILVRKLSVSSQIWEGWKNCKSNLKRYLPQLKANDIEYRCNLYRCPYQDYLLYKAITIALISFSKMHSASVMEAAISSACAAAEEAK